LQEKLELENGFLSARPKITHHTLVFVAAILLQHATLRPMKTITSMKAWMLAATTEEQEALAERINTTRATLYQYASGHRTASAERAGVIERITADMHKASKGRLPRIYRTDLSDACLRCEYAQKCLKGRAIVSEFPIVSADKTEAK
jgi:hypothetical protein